MKQHLEYLCDYLPLDLPSWTHKSITYLNCAKQINIIKSGKSGLKRISGQNSEIKVLFGQHYIHMDFMDEQ
jgi:hypothetical protein